MYLLVLAVLANKDSKSCQDAQTANNVTPANGFMEDRPVRQSHQWNRRHDTHSCKDGASHRDYDHEAPIVDQSKGGDHKDG